MPEFLFPIAVDEAIKAIENHEPRTRLGYVTWAIDEMRLNGALSAADWVSSHREYYHSGLLHGYIPMFTPGVDVEAAQVEPVAPPPAAPALSTAEVEILKAVEPVVENPVKRSGRGKKAVTEPFKTAPVVQDNKIAGAKSDIVVMDEAESIPVDLSWSPTVGVATDEPRNGIETPLGETSTLVVEEGQDTNEGNTENPG